MYKPEWLIVDPICTFVFSLLVMVTTVPTFLQCTDYLMECTPDEIRTDHIRGDIIALPEVAAITDFHVWGLAGDKFFLTAHIALNEDLSSFKALDVDTEEDTELLGEMNIVRKVHEKCLEIAKRNNVCHSTF